MKRKIEIELDSEKGELIVSDSNGEIVHWFNLGLVEIEGFEAAMELGGAALLVRLKEIGNNYLYDKYGVKRFLDRV